MMSCSETINRIRDLRLLRTVYLRLYSDPYKEIYKEEDILILIDKTSKTIEKLVDNLLRFKHCNK